MPPTLQLDGYWVELWRSIYEKYSEAVRQMGQFGVTAALQLSLLLLHFCKDLFSPDIIIHFGMRSWLTSKKYIRGTAISKGKSIHRKVGEINSR